jgi:hypothetical protein
MFHAETNFPLGYPTARIPLLHICAKENFVLYVHFYRPEESVLNRSHTPDRYKVK